MPLAPRKHKPSAPRLPSHPTPRRHGRRADLSGGQLRTLRTWRRGPPLGRTCSRDPAAPSSGAREWWVSPGVRPAHPAALRKRLGRGLRGRSCPAAGRRDARAKVAKGNLSNSSAPVPASCIIHGRRRDAGAAPLHRPGLSPRRGAWWAKPSTWQGLCVTPGTGVPNL